MDLQVLGNYSTYHTQQLTDTNKLLLRMQFHSKGGKSLLMLKKQWSYSVITANNLNRRGWARAVINMKNQTQRINQKLINAELRLAVRQGRLPYVFTDKNEQTYRQIVYKLGREMNRKYSATKVGDKWTIDIA